MDETENTQESSRELRKRYVYLMLQNADPAAADSDVSLLDLWGILWRKKLFIIAVSIVFVVLSVPYALVQTEWYRADTMLAPADENSMDLIPSQLGGLASLAGVRLNRGGITEPLAILRSREFSRKFIEDYNLLPVLFAEEWDAENETWISDDPDSRPDLKDAVRLFREDILAIDEDSQPGLVALAIEWIDPELAATWANAIVARINEHMRQRSLNDAQANVEFLQEELARTNVVTLQQSIGRLLETELQKLMLARGNDEFAFRVIDEAVPPKRRVRPNRVLIVVVAGILGGMFSVFLVFTASMVRGVRAQRGGAELSPDGH